MGARLGVLDHGAERDSQLEVLASGAMLLGALPVGATTGTEVPASAEGREIAQTLIRDHDDVAPATAVAAIGPALGHVRLATEADAAVAAASCLYVDRGSVVKHGFPLPRTRAAAGFRV